MTSQPPLAARAALRELRLAPGLCLPRAASPCPVALRLCCPRCCVPSPALPRVLPARIWCLGLGLVLGALRGLALLPAPCLLPALPCVAGERLQELPRHVCCSRLEFHLRVKGNHFVAFSLPCSALPCSPCSPSLSGGLWSSFSPVMTRPEISPTSPGSSRRSINIKLAGAVWSF